MTANLPCAEWDVSADDFPADGSSEERLGFILNYAILAPSIQNTQPWVFRIHGNVLDLFADRSRSLPVMDPEGREMCISCGAALFHIRLALQYFGVSSEITLLPDGRNPLWLARIVLGMRCDTECDLIPLFHAIPYRHTNRQPYRPEPVPDEILDEIRADAEHEGAQLHLAIESNTRNDIADLIAEGDRIQWSSRAFRRELAVWLRPNARPGRDGIPGSAEGLTAFASEIAPLVIRTFDLGKGRAAKDREIAMYSPVLALLATPSDSRRDWLAAGQALARVLLRARSEEVWASFLNQPVEVVSLRPKLMDCFGRSGVAQILMRLGYADPAPPTPRRSVSQVLVRPEHGSVRIAVHASPGN